MSFVNRQLYKQKPQAWGPVSSVQASIFKNAEMAGIDPGSIALCMPLWDPGSFQDYSQNLFKPTISGAVFTENSWYMDGTDDRFYFADNALWTPSKSLTAFIKGKLISVPLSGTEGIISHYRGTDALGNADPQRAWQLGVNASSQLNAALSSSGSYQSVYNTVISTTLSANEAFDCALVWQASSRNDIYFKGNKTANASKPASLYNASTQLMIGNQYNDLNSAAYNLSALNAYFNFVLLLNNFAATDSQIAQLSDNPYFLLHRQAPVFYSVPGGTPPTFNPLFLNAAQPTRVIQ